MHLPLVTIGLWLFLFLLNVDKSHAARIWTYPDRWKLIPYPYDKKLEHIKYFKKFSFEYYLDLGHDPQQVYNLDFYEAEYDKPCDYEKYTHYHQGHGWRHRTQHMEDYLHHYRRLKKDYDTDIKPQGAAAIEKFVQDICYTSFDYDEGHFGCDHKTKKCVCRDDAFGRTVREGNVCVYANCRYCFHKYGPIKCQGKLYCNLFPERNFFRCMPGRYPRGSASDYYCPPESPEPAPTPPEPKPTTSTTTTAKSTQAPEVPTTSSTPPTPSSTTLSTTSSTTTKPTRPSTKYPPVARWTPC